MDRRTDRRFSFSWLAFRLLLPLLVALLAGIPKGGQAQGTPFSVSALTLERPEIIGQLVADQPSGSAILGAIRGATVADEAGLNATVLAYLQTLYNEFQTPFNCRASLPSGFLAATERYNSMQALNPNTQLRIMSQAADVFWGPMKEMFARSLPQSSLPDLRPLMAPMIVGKASLDTVREAATRDAFLLASSSECTGELVVRLSRGFRVLVSHMNASR